MATPSRRLICRRAALVFHITQRIEAFLSLRVKYTWPEAGRERFEISPSTHTSCRVGSLSNCLRMRKVSWETVKWLEEYKSGCIDMRIIEKRGIVNRKVVQQTHAAGNDHSLLKS